jgi:hypothetical protein
MADHVFVTCFGTVKTGPLFGQAVSELSFHLRKRGKARNMAKKQLEEIEQAVNVLASVYWNAGKILKKTP